MAHEDLDTWLGRQEKERKKSNWLCNRAVPIVSRPRALQQEPPLLAALRGAYSEQQTTSDCSLTSVTILVKALVKKDPPYDREQVLSLVGAPGADAWREATKNNGPGVKFIELLHHARAVFGKLGFELTSAQPRRERAAEEGLRALLRALSPDSALLLYLDQGVFTGDRNVPHVTPVGAYDAEGDRVLILEVDGDLPSLYLAPFGAVMEAMQRTVDDKDDALFGQQGGWLHVQRR